MSFLVLNLLIDTFIYEHTPNNYSITYYWPGDHSPGGPCPGAKSPGCPWFGCPWPGGNCPGGKPVCPS
jgi:hypothetical protein